MIEGMIAPFGSLVHLAFISKSSVRPTATSFMSAMNQEVVDLVSSSSESSCSSRGIGLLDGTRPLQCGHVKIDESVGGVEECDENSVSSMDSSLFDAHEIIGDASRQNNNDIGSSSSDIEILSSAGINNSDDTSSSSSSSGLPGSSPLKRPVMMNQPDQDADNSEQSTAIDIDDTVPIASSCKEVSIPPAKRKNSKRRAWGQKSKASKTNNNQANNESSSTVPKQPSSTFNHCYLLRSLDPDHPLKTYIGFTTHPSRRIRQHNGILKNGGARRTRRSGRPWTFCCIVGGFESKTAALQFEWAWQNVGRSKAFREAVGDDVLARKMGRRRGVRARLEELRLLLNVCKPWCESDRFTVYFMEEKIHLQFCELLSKAEKDGKDLSRNSDLTRRVCSVEDMPFAIDLESKKKRGKQAAAAASIGDEVAESDRSHGDDEESVAKSDERSTSSSSSESDVANVVGLDMRNLSIDQRRYSWEDLSVGSGVETHVTSVGDNDRENKSTNTANKESVPVYDLCDSP
jgi:predicted GIY-YIG superfamily endonuclease